jgi:hypothetical protein
VRIESVRDLKLEVAVEVFAPLVDDLLDRAFKPTLGTVMPPSPIRRIALGIGRGRGPGDFTLAVRLQAKLALLQKSVDLVRARAGDEVDVRFIGRVRAHDQAIDASDLRKVCRPLVVGCSIAHIASTAGTLGLIARHRKSGRSIVLSNAHVLAQSGNAKLGDAISQPGRLDGGDSNVHVAALLDFVPLRFVGSGSNQIDGAIAIVDDSVALTRNTVPGLGTFTIADDAAILPGLKVAKLGRTTGLTHGEILATELDDVLVDYDAGSAVFDHQTEIAGLPNIPFSDRGDSGSLVVDENMRAIGLVFCGNPNANDGKGLSYANHLPRVMTALDLVSL